MRKRIAQAKHLLMMLIAFTFISGTACSQGNKEVTKQKNPVVIDVRTQAEFDAGHIEGAELIPYDVIKDKIAKLVPDKDTEIALYCRSGRRSGIATTVLQELGYTNVENYGSMAAAKEKLNVGK